MGVRTLAGTYDGTEEAAVMVDSGNDWPVGPLFKGDDAYEQVEAFQEWLRLEPWLRAASVHDLGGLEPADLPHPAATASDPRAWPQSGLAKLVGYWRDHFLDEDGALIAKPDEG